MTYEEAKEKMYEDKLSLLDFTLYINEVKSEGMNSIPISVLDGMNTIALHFIDVSEYLLADLEKAIK
jgi:hypothetical protein